MILTGDPNIPPYLSEANEIKELNIEISKGVTGSEEELFSPDDIEEAEE